MVDGSIVLALITGVVLGIAVPYAIHHYKQLATRRDVALSALTLGYVGVVGGLAIAQWLDRRQQQRFAELSMDLVRTRVNDACTHRDPDWRPFVARANFFPGVNTPFANSPPDNASPAPEANPAPPDNASPTANAVPPQSENDSFTEVIE